MGLYIPEEFSTRLIGWSHFVIVGNTMPPRDPEEDEEDDDEGGGRGTRRRTTSRARAGRSLERFAKGQRPFRSSPALKGNPVL